MQSDPSEYAVFENAHEAVIEESVFERVQEIRGSGKRRRNSSGRVSILSGLVFCADCKSKMYLSNGASLNAEQDNYTCSGFRTKKKCCHSAHFIRRVVLEKAVLLKIQQVTAFLSEHEKEFAEKPELQDDDKFAHELAVDKKTLAKSEKRIQELDNIIQQLYEDKVAGNLNAERFVRLSEGYELEQKDLEAKVKSLQKQFTDQVQNRMNVDMFLNKVRKYTSITELSTVMLNELVESIEVHARSKCYSKGTQRINIVFNYVGDIGGLGLPPNPQEEIQEISAENTKG
jgi:hypothetical protein